MSSVPSVGNYFGSVKKVDARDNKTIKGTASSDSLSGTNSVGKDSTGSAPDKGKLGALPSRK